MKMKRFIALALAFVMLASSLFVGPTGDVTYAYEKDQVVNELRKVDAGKKAEVSKNNLFADKTSSNSDSNSVSNENILSPDEKESLGDAETTGVQTGQDVAVTDKKPEGTETKNETSTEIKVNVEKVDKSEISADLTAGVVNNTLLNEDTVTDSDIVDVIILFDADAVLDENPDAELNFFTKISISIKEFAQNLTINKIEKNIFKGEELDIDYQYTWLLNGIATSVPYGVIDEIEAISGVEDVILQPVYEVCKTDSVETLTNADGGMIGREDTWASGYTGLGVKIAIVDTGIDEDHQNFQPLAEDKLTADSATKESIEAVIGSLNASKAMPGLTAEKVYLSNKVAYAFNYADNNLSINHKDDLQGDHGTHVAGIAAANPVENSEVVGVAPDAQLYVMKVFGQNPSGASAAALLAAVEDAIILGADVINMSVGSAAGFTSDGAEFDAIYGKVAEAGVILAISAGNSETSAYGNIWGTNQNLTSNPDNATISSPGTYIGATTVASVENIKYMSAYVEVAGNKFAFYPATTQAEGTLPSNAPVETISGKEYEIVYVPNAGQTAEDFAGVDCEGKVVLVQRGVTAFTEKCELAEAAGAVACIVFNNEPGIFGMNMDGGTATIPAVSISLQSGEQILASMDENPAVKVVLSAEEALVPNEDGYKMSTFSSWGVSPDLKLEPDITAPGGMIYSTMDDGTYGIMSGTSMSSPNVAGLAALLQQYVRETYPTLSKDETHEFINALLMSTATILENGELAYSPRLQGTGLANAYLAINTNAYLTVDGMDMPKVELYDDPAKTGKYGYSFNVVNFGDSTIYYHVNTNVQTEGADTYQLTETESISFMNSTPVALDAITSKDSASFVLTYDYNADKKANILDAYELYVDVLGKDADNAFFRYNLDNDEDIDNADVQAYLNALVGKTEDVVLDDTVLEVKAGETVSVDVTVDVTAEGKEYMDTYFENGIYVEGFTTLTAESTGDVDLSLPYLAFYGDWTQAPMLDSGYYWEGEVTGANQYPHVLWSNYGGELSVWLPGYNPYFLYAEEFDVNNIVFSPNGDGYADYIDDMYVSLLRNAAELTFSYVAEDGTVLFEEVRENVKKTIYMDGYQQIVPYVYSWYSYPYEFTDVNGNPLADGTKLTLKISAKPDYDKHESNNVYDTWEVPMTIDLSAPTILEAFVKQEVDETTGTTKHILCMKFADNHATAAVNFLSKSGTVLFAQYPVDHSVEEGTEYVEYDVTGYGEEFMVALGDYAFNEGVFYIEAEENNPKLDETLLYGYRVYDALIGDDSLFGWIGIDKETAATTTYSSEYYMDYSLVAAEYVGGYILAVDANKDLVAIKPGYWDERTRIASLGTELKDMAFDPTTETLYGLHKDEGRLVTIDITTGEMTALGYEYAMYDAFTLTCDDEGQLYAINSSGELMKVNKETGEFDYEAGVVLDTREITGKYPSNTQSMTYDSENNCIYWAFFHSSIYGEVIGTLYKIELAGETPTMTAIDTIAGNAEVVGLLSLDNRDFELPTDEALTDVAIEQESVALLVGGSENLALVLTPWYGVKGNTTWISSNPEVAVVSERGKVTATGVGVATITVTVEVNEEVTLTAETTVKVINPSAKVNGYVLAGDSLYNQWVTFDAEDMSYVANTDFSFTVYTAGEYVDGTIYVYGQDTSFYKVDAETYKATLIRGPRSDFQIVDMSYDYSTGYMYALAQDMMTGDTYLAHIDMITGEIYTLGFLCDEYEEAMCALAVSTDGTIYVLSYTGFLHTVDVIREEDPWGGVFQYCELTSLGYVGYSGSLMIQSMTYDHNADEPGLYWSMMSASDFAMVYIDIESVTALKLGSFDGGVQMTSMYIAPEEVPELDYVPVTDINQTADAVTVLVGGTAVPPVEINPLNATNRVIEWTVEDTDVAVVENGLVKGVGKGSTVAVGTIEVEADGETFSYEIELTINVIDAAGDIRGYLLTDMATGDSGFWISVNDADLSSGSAITDYTEYLLYAGTYYDGYLYGYGKDLETWDSVFVIAKEVEGADIAFGEALYETVEIIPGEYPDVVDMAFDYTEGVMYAVAGTENVYGANALYCVDIETGELYKVGDMSDQVMTLACDATGALYGIGMYGTLYSINKYTAENEYITDLGILANQYQSMTYDYNTGNIYWAQMAYDQLSWSSSSNLYILNPNANPENGESYLMDLGHIGMYGAEISALHTIPSEPIEIGEAEVKNVSMSSSSEILMVGDTVEISAVALPISVNVMDVDFTFASSDETVATVDENGVVTAVKAGKAVITATTNGISASCTVNVVDENITVQAMNENGWQVTPLFNPSKIKETVSFPENVDFDMAMVTYADGWYYALDRENAYTDETAEYQTIDYSRGYLWRFNEDFTEVERVSDVPVYTTYTNTESMYPDELQLLPEAVLDIFTNPFTGDVYVLGRMIEDWGWGEYYQYHIYKLNVTNGSTEYVGTIGYDIGNAQKAEFISGDTMVVWDHMEDYIYTVALNEQDEEGYLVCNQLVFAQSVMAASYKLAMAYNKELDAVFLASIDEWGLNDYKMGLYMLDPHKKTIKKVADTAFDEALIDLVFVQ